MKEAAENIVLVRSGEWMCGVGMCAVSGPPAGHNNTTVRPVTTTTGHTNTTLPDICLKIIFCAS